MGSRVDLARVAEVLDGDPLLTPVEAADELGIYVEELAALTAAGLIAYIQPCPDSPRAHGNAKGIRRYRTSVIAALKTAGVPELPR